MTALASALAHVFRALRRTPGASATAVACLALGTAVVTTMFAGADPWLFRPLPYAEPSRLLSMREVDPRGGIRLVSAPSYFALKDEVGALAGVGAVVRTGFNLTTEDEPERVHGALVTASLFPLLGARPAEGRLFTEEESLPGGPAVCLVGDALWRRLSAPGTAVSGRTLRIDGEIHTIVGRMPAGWGFPEYAQVWTPLRLDAADRDRARRGLDVIARLAPAAPLERAREELHALAARAAAEHPETSAAWGFRAAPLLHELTPPGIRTALFLMLGASGFVLLIACANVSNVLLARSLDRRRELATRLALGAGPRQIVVQSLLESFVLALAAGLLGLLLAHEGVVLLKGAIPIEPPFWATMELNLRVLAATLASCLLACVAAGLVPALESARLDVRSVLQEGARGSRGGGRSRRWGQALVAAEIGTSVVLLSGALLLVRSFWERQRFDLGLRPEGALAAHVALSGSAYREASARTVFLDEVVRRVDALAGVEAAAALSSLPMSDEVGGGWSSVSLEVEGTPTPEAERPAAVVVAATAKAFAALGVAIREGEPFRESDAQDGNPVAVISEGLARRHWPSGGALGRRLRLEDGEWLRVVGIAEEVREPASILGIDPRPRGQVWVPYRRRPSSNVTLVLRSREPAALAGALRRELRALDPRLPVYEVRTLVEARRRADWVARLWGEMLAWAAGVGILLACAGVYGVVARGVARRTQEIGVRMALGADRRAVLALVLAEEMKPATVGAMGGLFGALVMTRALGGLLHGVSASDPATLVGSAAALSAVAALATYLPARRATAVDPITALRSE
jgi:predicted permease